MAVNLDNDSAFTNGLYPNILDGYYSYSYNISLKLYGYDVQKELRLPEQTDKHVIIADSGVTGQFYIKGMEMETTVGSTNPAHNMLVSKITMVIDEPLGFTLIDRLLQAGLDLGIESLPTAAYEISISFTGWDANGVNRVPIGSPKRFVASLTNVIPDFSKKGTTYTLLMVNRQDLATQNKKMEVPKLITFVKADTLDETLKNFSTELNKSNDVSSEGSLQTIRGNKDDTNRYKMTYSFNLQDSDTAYGKMTSWTMDKNKQQGGDQSTSITDVNGNGQNVITVQPGTHIADVVTSILGNTKEAYLCTCPAASPQTAKLQPNEFPSFFHYEPTYTSGVFDPVLKSESANINFNINPKIISRNNFLTSAPADEYTIQKLQQQKILVKGYEYIFTGENTSVLDAKLNFSSMWSDSSPIFTAALRDRAASIIPSVSINPLYDVPPTVRATNRSDIESSNLSGEFLFNAKKPDTNSLVSFLEDYSTTSLEIERFSSYEPSRDSSCAEQVIRGASPVGNQESNAKISIFSYMYDLTNTGPAMTNIQLTIRGDPWWFGITPQEAQSNYNGAPYSDIKNNQSDYAVFQYAEQNIYLKFKTPTNIDINTGLLNQNSSVFNRIYSVNHIKHIFVNGVFKQELSLIVNRSISSKLTREYFDKIMTETNKTADFSNLSVVSTEGTSGKTTTEIKNNSVVNPILPISTQGSLFGTLAPPVVPAIPTPTTPLTFTMP